MSENLDRLSHPRMAYYREVYATSERWNGATPIDDKTVIVYCEQGFGDIIQFSRYFPLIKQRCAKVYLHCPKELHRLFNQFGIEMIDKEVEEIPPHDFHLCSMSLPFTLGVQDVPTPYLKVEEKLDLGLADDTTKIGIAWEGNPEHTNNAVRNCPLKHFESLCDGSVKLVMVQKYINVPELTAGCEDMELFAAEVDDFYDTATLLNAVDFVVSIDTSVVHLAGALGKKAYVLLSNEFDPRWAVKSWYDSLVFVKQTTENDWEGAFRELNRLLKENA